MSIKLIKKKKKKKDTTTLHICFVLRYLMGDVIGKLTNTLCDRRYYFSFSVVTLTYVCNNSSLSPTCGVYLYDINLYY
jgi:hypothetical protein